MARIGGKWQGLKRKRHMKNKKIILRKFDEEKMVEEIEQKSERLCKYRKGNIGFFSFGDASPAIGGGIGVFLWFNSHDELYKFLADYFVVLAPGPSSADHEAVFVAVGGLVQELAAGKLEKNEAIKKINEAAKNFSQIEWWGTFEDLCHGNGEFQEEVRGRFLGRHDKVAKKNESVPKERGKEFVRFLSEYGF